MVRHSSYSQQGATARSQADKHEHDRFQTQEAQAWQSTFPNSHYDWAPLTAVVKVAWPSVDTHDLYNRFLTGYTITANPPGHLEGQNSATPDYYHGQEVPFRHYTHQHAATWSHGISIHPSQVQASTTNAVLSLGPSTDDRGSQLAKRGRM